MEALGIMIMATYETFAAVYDAVMDDSLYDKWTDFSLCHFPNSFIINLLAKISKIKSLLDSRLSLILL